MILDGHSCPNCHESSIAHIANVSVTKKQFAAELRHCYSCDFLYLDSPFWLDVAYENEFFGDTGYIQRNYEIAGFLHLVLLIGELLSWNSLALEVTDIGTGLGMLPRMLRDYGFVAYGVDSYSGMQLIQPFVDPVGSTLVKTAFEVVEHLPNLDEFLQQEIPNSELLVFSTQLRKDGHIPSLDWWYYAFESGQHISFHSRQSLVHAMGKVGLPASCLITADKNLSLHAIVKGQLLRKSFLIASALRRRGLAVYALRLLKAASKRHSLTWQDHLFIKSLVSPRRSPDKEGVEN
jgi:hypothetical protein